MPVSKSSSQQSRLRSLFVPSALPKPYNLPYVNLVRNAMASLLFLFFLLFSSVPHVTDVRVWGVVIDCGVQLEKDAEEGAKLREKYAGDLAREHYDEMEISMDVNEMHNILYPAPPPAA